MTKKDAKNLRELTARQLADGSPLERDHINAGMIEALLEERRYLLHIERLQRKSIEITKLAVRDLANMQRPELNADYAHMLTDIGHRMTDMLSMLDQWRADRLRKVHEG